LAKIYPDRIYSGGFKNWKEVSGAATEVECCFALFGVDHRKCRASPRSVEIERKEAIDFVIAWGDFAEHLLNHSPLLRALGEPWLFVNFGDRVFDWGHKI
jgi:hypothetical protein